MGKPILEVDIDEEWKSYEINVKSLLDFTQRFYKQGGDKKKVSSSDLGYLLSPIASANIHFYS